MNPALLMALRSLRRAPRRTALALAAGAGGLAVAVLLVNLARGMAAQAVADAVRLGPGHLAVHRAGYLPAADPALRIAGADALVRRIESLPGVASAVPRLYAAALASPVRPRGDGASSRAVLLAGVDPRREAAAGPLAARVASGTFLDRAGPDAVVLGDGIARALGLAVGDEIALAVPGAPAGAGGGPPLRVAGILDPALDQIVPGAAWAPLGRVRALAGDPGAAHGIAVFLDRPSPALAGATRGRIAALAPPGAPLDVATWEQSLPQLRDALALDALVRALLVAGLFAIVGIGVAATLVASVLERTREHGLLLALGTPPSLLRGTLVAEGALLGLAAAALGTAAGSALTALLAQTGLDVRGLFRDEVAYGGALFSLDVRPAWDAGAMGAAAAGLLAVHLAAAAWPAWRAGRALPAEALRSR